MTITIEAVIVVPTAIAEELQSRIDLFPTNGAVSLVIPRQDTYVYSDTLPIMVAGKLSSPARFDDIVMANRQATIVFRDGCCVITMLSPPVREIIITGSAVKSYKYTADYT